MKILLLTSAFPRFRGNSSGNFVWEMAEEIAKGGINDVSVLAPDSPISVTKDEWGDVRIFRFSYFLKKYQKLNYDDSVIKKIRRNPALLLLMPFFLTAQFFALVTLQRKERFNVIHAHWLLPQGFAAVLAKKIFGFKYKVVISVHGTDVNSLNSHLLRKVKKWIICNADMIAPVSSDLRKKILDLAHHDKVEIIPMGTSIPDQSDLKREYLKPYILFLGRLTEFKGVTYLLDAFEKLSNSELGLDLLIVGDGLLREELQEKANRLGLEEKVHFIGNVNHYKVWSLYKHAEVFVIPSIVTSLGETEGFGLVIIEAMLSRCPVVGSDVGGISDIIKNGVNGLLVPEKDPNKLHQAILNITTDTTKRQRLINNAYKTARDSFSWDVISKRFEKSYTEILKT